MITNYFHERNQVKKIIKCLQDSRISFHTLHLPLTHKLAASEFHDEGTSSYCIESRTTFRDSKSLITN
jgi:hypothetical protein